MRYPWKALFLSLLFPLKTNVPPFEEVLSSTKQFTFSQLGRYSVFIHVHLHIYMFVSLTE